MPEEAVQSAGLRFGEGDGSGSPLAPHVIVGHVDIASAGVRALLILRETLWRWAGPDRIASTAGAVWAAADEEGADGSAAPCPPAWGCGGDQVAPRAAPLQVDTFHGADGKPVLSVVCINAQFPSRSANAIALDLVRKVIADKVSGVSVVASARFNPNPSSKEHAGKAHLLQMRGGSSASSLPGSSPFASWDPTCEINDSLLAAVVQLLNMEDEVEVDCVLAPGYRLPQEICLNLPSKQADVTAESVKVLYDSLAHCNAATAIQAAGAAGKKLQVLDRAALETLRPACALTVGEFAPIQPDSAAAFYK